MNIIKKGMVYFLAAALAATMTAAAAAETDEAMTVGLEALETAEPIESAEPAQENLITGTILEIDLEAGEALIENDEMGEVLVRFENTLLDGMPMLYPGVEVTFETTGVATMSLPAQMNAVRVECSFIEGTVTGFEDGMLLIDTESMGMVAAHLSAGPRVYGLEHFVQGAKATVFFDGVTTRSIPAQLVPDVLVFEANGEVESAEQEEIVESGEDAAEDETTQGESIQNADEKKDAE